MNRTPTSGYQILPMGRLPGRLLRSGSWLRRKEGSVAPRTPAPVGAYFRLPYSTESRERRRCISVRHRERTFILHNRSLTSLSSNMTIEEVDVKSAMLQSHYSFLPLVWPIGHLGEGAPRSPTKILQFYSPEGGPKWPIGPCGQTRGRNE
jgi:hypothetical protein